MFHPPTNVFTAGVTLFIVGLFFCCFFGRREPAGFAHFGNAIRGVDEDEEIVFFLTVIIFINV